MLSVSLLTMLCVIASLAQPVAPWAGALQNRSAPRLHASGLELCEQLEPVTEAAIDHRRAAVTAAARRAEAWWRAHRQALPARGNADSTIAAMVQSAQHGATVEAARAAIGLSIHALEWDGEARTTATRLMLIDLVGMVGWIRASGGELDWPRDVPGVVDSLANTLEQQHRPRAAAGLRRSVTTVLADTGDKASRKAAALELLEIVDQLERVIR